jgi:hypothetical protein
MIQPDNKKLPEQRFLAYFVNDFTGVTYITIKKEYMYV